MLGLEENSDMFCTHNDRVFLHVFSGFRPLYMDYLMLYFWIPWVNWNLLCPVVCLDIEIVKEGRHGTIKHRLEVCLDTLSVQNMILLCTLRQLYVDKCYEVHTIHFSSPVRLQDCIWLSTILYYIHYTTRWVFIHPWGDKFVVQMMTNKILVIGDTVHH